MRYPKPNRTSGIGATLWRIRALFAMQWVPFMWRRCVHEEQIIRPEMEDPYERDSRGIPEAELGEEQQHAAMARMKRRLRRD